MYSRLEEGFKDIGVICEFVNAYPSMDYPRRHRPGRIGQLVEVLGARRWSAPRRSPARVAWMVLQGLGLSLLLLRSLPKFDVFIFASGVSFLWGLDLPLLRLCGKRVIVIYHGSDCRPPYINGAYVGADVTLDVQRCIRLTRRTRRWVRWVDRYADVVVSHPYYSHFNAAACVSWLKLGHPYEVPNTAVLLSNQARRPCVIVHAPTRPVPKGSAEIEAAVNRLRLKGHDLTFVKIVGRPPQDVLDAVADCDFVVDELFSDTPMAAFATEAAAMGKPAVVGMHDVETLRSTVGPELFAPALVCHPDGLDEAIEKLVVDAAYRRELGAQAREYVRTHLNPQVVALRFLRLAAGDFPSDWQFVPSSVRYLYGWGLTTSRLREVVTAVVAHGGLDALCLSDKPEILRAFYELTVDGAPTRDRRHRGLQGFESPVVNPDPAQPGGVMEA